MIGNVTGVIMIQRILLVLSFLACIAIVVLGGLHWKGQIKEAGEKAAVVEKNLGSEKKQEGADEQENEEDLEKELSPKEELEVLVSNLPKEAANHFLQAYDKKESVKLMFIGSDAMGVLVNGWSTKVKAKLEEAYGERVEVVLKEHYVNTNQYIQDGTYESDIGEKADIIVLEPFTIQDNEDMIMIEHSIEALDIFLARLKEVSPESVLMVQPPQPIYQAVNYPKQVEAIKGWAAENGVTFADHWTAWPDYNSEKFLEYIDGDVLPNEKGHLLWADVIIDLFVNVEKE